MGSLALAFGLILLIATVRSDDAPKGPKVTHKVCTGILKLYFLSYKKLLQTDWSVTLMTLQVFSTILLLLFMLLEKRVFKIIHFHFIH